MSSGENNIYLKKCFSSLFIKVTHTYQNLKKKSHNMVTSLVVQ